MVEILVDGRAVRALDGQSVAGALHKAGVAVLRRNPVTGEPRGAYCGMGVCFECLCEVDGRQSVQSCMIEVADGMRVRLSMGARRIEAVT